MIVYMYICIHIDIHIDIQIEKDDEAEYSNMLEWCTCYNDKTIKSSSRNTRPFILS